MNIFPDYFSKLAGATLVCTDEENRIDLKLDKNKIASYNDITLKITEQNEITVCADKTPLSWIILRFVGKLPSETLIYGDDWERGYGDLHWEGIVPERRMPWYFLTFNKDKKALAGYGVAVRPNAMCTWHLDGNGVSLYLDVRSGGMGVILNGRTLNAAKLVCAEYENTDAFSGGHQFCKLMCTDPIFPKEPVYGSNNWYYAYGVSSREEILTDTEYVAELTKNLDNRPFMVIDDGWQKNNCAGPWDKGNEKFGDMKSLADEMKSKGVKAGIWIRLLYDKESKFPDECYLMRDKQYLDPSHPAVLEHISSDIRRLVEWGFTLIKHDYSAYDMFGGWGMDRDASITNSGWHFYDRSKTSAEITLNFYREIRKAARDSVIIGCNTFSHLCAGLVEVNRTGDDTSGKEWNRTRNRGVNTLAFRMMQNRAFYMADADCVGLTREIPWSLNREWLFALSRSGSPLFISSAKGVADEAMIKEMREAYACNSKQDDTFIPIDWLYNVCPEKWLLNGEEISLNWY